MQLVLFRSGVSAFLSLSICPGRVFALLPSLLYSLLCSGRCIGIRTRLVGIRLLGSVSALFYLALCRPSLFYFYNFIYY